jgi:hypothetical protein
MGSLQTLSNNLRAARPKIVAIDGGLGAGKTDVANQLATSLKWNCVHLDAYLFPGRGSFEPSMDYDELQRAIIEADEPAIVEGVCILAVLQRISLIPNFLVFVDPAPQFKDTPKAPILDAEVKTYLERFLPRSKADAIIQWEQPTMTDSTAVDIAYIRSKTLISIVLALGGIAQTISGALLLNAGLNDHGSATLSIMGTQLSATGLGGIVLCTSVMWAYFAYLSRPKYSSVSESRNTTKPDGSSESYVFRSSTQLNADPGTRSVGPKAD